MADKPARYGQEDLDRLNRYTKKNTPFGRDGLKPLEDTLAAANGRKAASRDDVVDDSNRRFLGMDDSGEQKRLKETSELADQYKRETRGNVNNSPRGKIKMKKPEGYAKGGSVRGCGAASKGKTKGKMR